MGSGRANVWRPCRSSIIRRGYLETQDDFYAERIQKPGAMAGFLVFHGAEGGLEPTRLRRQNLNLVRLPIPPLPLRGLGFRHQTTDNANLVMMGWLMGLEPTTTGITILDSTN